MRRVDGVALACGAALVCAGFGVHALTPPRQVEVAPHWTQQAAQAFAAQPMEQRTLPNGLRLMVVPKRGAPWCGLATVVAGGASTDPPGQSGLAHLAEHLFFEEGGGLTPSRGDTDGEALGMRSNAFTLGDYTVLVEEFSPAVLEQALAIHAQRLRQLTFTTAQLEREKTVVTDERRFRVEEPPLAAAQELLVARLWGTQHVFGRPVLGWPNDVAALTSDQVRAWVDGYMRPQRAALALVGPVDAAQTLAALEKVLAPWTARGPAGALPIATPAQGQSDLATLQSPFGGALVGFAVAPLGSGEEAVDRVLARLLTLDPDVVLQGGLTAWPQDARLDVEHVLQVHHGEFLITVQAAPQDANPPGRVVGLYLDALAQHGPRPDVLDGVTAQLVADLHRSLGSHTGRAEALAVDAALLGRPLATAERMRALRAVDVAAVRRRAAVLRRAPTASVVVESPPEEP
jgi:predicted Zn-dependent peptidase